MRFLEACTFNRYKEIFMGQALKKTSSLTIEDILYPSVEAALENHSEEEIFEIQSADLSSEDIISGHVSINELKNFLQESEADNSHFQVKSLGSEEWSPLFKHPSFQRRKPQLVSLDELNVDNELDYYLIMKGAKKGPYDKFQISTMIDKKEILLTDMASINGGHTWTKLYTLEGFDRRTLKESPHLPGIPSDVIERGNEEVLTDAPVTEAIAGLAYLSNVKRGKAVESHQTETQVNQNYDYKSSSFFNASIFYKGLLVASVLGIAYFGHIISGQLSSPFQDNSPTVGEHAEMLTPVTVDSIDPTTGRIPPTTRPSAKARLGEQNNRDQINDQSRNTEKFTTRQMQPILPARKSFMETKTFQDSAREVENNDVVVGDDPNYFYDNSSAMELDPVRSQISKENYDDSMMRDENPLPVHDDLFDNEIAY